MDDNKNWSNFEQRKIVDVPKYKFVNFSNESNCIETDRDIRNYIHWYIYKNVIESLHLTLKEVVELKKQQSEKQNMMKRWFKMLVKNINNLNG